MSAVDIGQITEALNDKTDRDNRNVDTVVGADAVIEFQVPTAENNYTWYRKYKSGWVEQGGIVSVPSQLQATIVNLVIEMANTNYNVVATINSLGTSWTGEFGTHAVQTSTTTISLQHGAQADPSNISWQVSGMVA